MQGKANVHVFIHVCLWDAYEHLLAQFNSLRDRERDVYPTCSINQQSVMSH
jgi:hypothetical protein